MSCPVCLSVCNVGVLWPNGRMDQDETWHAGRPRPRRHCVRWASSSSTKRGTSAPTFEKYGLRRCLRHIIRGLCLLWPNGWMDQDAIWYGGRLRPWPHCVTWGPSSPSPKGHSAPSNVRPMSVVAKRSPISATAEPLFSEHARSTAAHGRPPTDVNEFYFTHVAAT